jgi:membrane protease YdiL (CAAX protease family)
MIILLAALPLFLAIIVANLVTARNTPGARLAFNLALFGGSLLLFLGGLALRFLPSGSLELPDMPGLDLNLAAITLLAIGLWGMLCSLSPVRKGLVKLFPALEPDSAVHTLALAAVGYLAGNALISAAPGTLEMLTEGGVQPTIVDVLSQQFVFVLAAFLGVGFLTRRESESLNQRLGLLRPTRAQLWTGLRWMIFFVFLQACIGALWALLDPAQAEALGGLNETLLGNFDTVWEWFLLAAAAGLGEELLFRGALQPIFGIIPTSLIFAVSHVQYGFSPATVTVFLLSVVLGIIRKRSNTTVAILVHAGYNFTLGLLSLLAVYLQSFVE